MRVRTLEKLAKKAPIRSSASWFDVGVVNRPGSSHSRRVSIITSRRLVILGACGSMSSRKKSATSPERECRGKTIASEVTVG